jgi:hypothetical protein
MTRSSTGTPGAGFSAIHRTTPASIAEAQFSVRRPIPAGSVFSASLTGSSSSAYASRQHSRWHQAPGSASSIVARRISGSIGAAATRQ